MPQLDPSAFSPQLIWLAISFLVLYVLMARIALPRVARLLEARGDKINGNIARAEQLKNEAAQALSAYESALAKAKAEAQALLQQAAADIAAEAQSREVAFAAKMKAEAVKAEAEIAAAKKAALQDVKSIAADLAKAISVKLTGSEPSPNRAEEAVSRVAHELEA